MKCSTARLPAVAAGRPVTAAVPLKGKRVVLKPNLVEYHRDKVINTKVPGPIS